MDSGVTRTRISSYRGKFQWTFDQVKWHLVRVNGNLSYPSRNNWQVGWNQGKLDLVWIIGEFNLSEFELSGFYHSNKMGWNFCFRKDISLNSTQTNQKSCQENIVLTTNFIKYYTNLLLKSTPTKWIVL